MKKLLTSMLVTVALAPALVLANPLSHLFSDDNNYGVCKKPGADNPNFCQCFIDQSVSTCLDAAAHHKHGILKSMCRSSFINSNIKHTATASGFCTKWSYMLPAGVDHPGCVESIDYYKTSC